MAGAKSSLIERMVGATFLSVDTFEEVEHDQDATGQAAMVVAVVAVVAVARGIGVSGEGLIVASFAAVFALANWAIWAGICYLVGDKLFGGKASWGELHGDPPGARYRQREDHDDHAGCPRCEWFPRILLLA